MLLSEYKSRIQTKFEGGNSLSVDWYSNAQEASESLREQINPTTLKRSVQIYGGLYDKNDVYYCPDDVDVPSTLYNPRNTREKWDYMPSQAYYNDTSSYKFTIETVNGLKRLLIRTSVSSLSHVLGTYDTLGTKVGAGLSVNTYNFLSGTGAIEGIFSDIQTNISDTFAVPVDITKYLNGIFSLPASFENGADVESVTIKLYTTPNDFYTLTVTNKIVSGWNLMRVEMSQRVATGFPVDTNIVSYSLDFKMKTGKSQKVIIDQITLTQGFFYLFEYYSDKAFINAAGDWVDAPTEPTDTINLSKREAAILVYEGCRIVALSAIKRKDIPPFDQELMRKYSTYWADNPSSALPQSYEADSGISKEFLMSDA